MKKLLPLFSCMLLIGCGEPIAQTKKPQLYNKNGVSFSYPGNWKITEDISLGADARVILIESPGDAIMCIQIYPEKQALSLVDYAKWFESNSATNVPFLKVTKSTFGTTQKHGVFERITADFSVVLLGENVPHTREFRRRQFASSFCYFTCQVASKDHDKTTSGFDQVLNSFSYAEP